MTYTIRPIEPGDESQWRVLWDGFCAFYQTELPEEATASLWRRLLDPDNVIKGIVVTDAEGTLLGIAHYFLHPHTWSDQSLCYLEDLFVTPEARGQGLGHALISHLIERGRQNGWRRIYWHTNTNNEAARRLYDRFATADDFVRYSVSL